VAAGAGRPDPHDGARHSAEWYRETTGVEPMRPGAPLLVPCDGGPSICQLETFPPRLEIATPGGVYVLVDDGPTDGWRYLYVSGAP
jgi:hypothetical protein